MDLETRLALLEAEVRAKDTGLLDRMTSAEKSLDSLTTWKNWVMGAGMAMAALIGFFAKPILNVLGFKTG